MNNGTMATPSWTKGDTLTHLNIGIKVVFNGFDSMPIYFNSMDGRQFRTDEFIKQ